MGDVDIVSRGLLHALPNVPSQNVKEIGLSIRTGRLGEPPEWCPRVISEVLLSALPNLKTIALNIELSYEADDDHWNQIFQLLAGFAMAGIKIFSYEAYMIQLPHSARQRDARLKTMTDHMKEIGMEIVYKPRARTMKEIPFNGFLLPAMLHHTAPSTVSRAISSAAWDSVW